MAIEVNSGYVSDANLQGYWRFEGNGDDTSSNNYDLTAVNSPSYDTGQFGSGVDL